MYEARFDWHTGYNKMEWNNPMIYFIPVARFMQHRVGLINFFHVYDNLWEILTFRLVYEVLGFRFLGFDVCVVFLFIPLGDE